MPKCVLPDGGKLKDKTEVSGTYRVLFSEQEVYDLARSWPGSDLDCDLFFEFQVRTQDGAVITDMVDATTSYDFTEEDDRLIAAIAEDAAEYLQKKLDVIARRVGKAPDPS